MSLYGNDDWVRCSSKTFQRDYWFNTRTGLTNWILEDNSNKEKIAIIVPFRDIRKEQERSKQMQQFIPLITQFLLKSNMPFKIYIIEQSDDNRKFNRGKLLNIGYVLAVMHQYSVFIFHDVDLIPSDDLLPYYCVVPQSKPIHIAKIWNRYNKNDKYFGGIVNFSSNLYEQVNGYPNNFWGWGGEDDELYKRVVKNNLVVDAPSIGSIVDLENLNLEQKLSYLKENQLLKCMNRKELLDEHDKSWNSNGLSDFKKCEQFEIVDRVILGPYAVKFTVNLSYNNHWSDKMCHENDKQY